MMKMAKEVSQSDAKVPKRGMQQQKEAIDMESLPQRNIQYFFQNILKIRQRKPVKTL